MTDRNGQSGYRYCLAWWTDRKTRMTVETAYCDTPSEARIAAVLAAVRVGWRPRKWWEWWRWREESQPLFPVVQWISDHMELDLEGAYDERNTSDEE